MGYLSFIVFLDVHNRVRASQFQKSNSAVMQAGCLLKNDINC